MKSVLLASALLGVVALGPAMAEQHDATAPDNTGKNVRDRGARR